MDAQEAKRRRTEYLQAREMHKELSQARRASVKEAIETFLQDGRLLSLETTLPQKGSGEAARVRMAIVKDGKRRQLTGYGDTADEAIHDALNEGYQQELPF